METPGFQSKKEQRQRCVNIKVVDLEMERFHQLERSLKKAQEENSTLRKLFHQLSEAFHFNLALLDDQNKELKTYDSVIATALALEHHSNVQEETQRYLDKCHQMKLEMQHKIQDVAGELAHQKQIKLLSRERDVYSRTLKSTQMFYQSLQTQLQNTYDEILNMTTITHSRIKKLEEKVEFMKRKLKEKEEQLKKFEEVLPALQSMNDEMKHQSQTQAENLNQSEELMFGLKNNLEVLTAQTQNVLEEHQQEVQQRDEEIKRLFSALQDTGMKWDQFVTQTSREMVEKNTHVIRLEKGAAKLSADVERSRVQMERYKDQVRLGLKRERDLEQMKVQLELDHQRHCEDLTSDHLLKNEKLIENLIHARDMAEAELKEKEKEVKDLSIMFDSVQKHRDQLVQGESGEFDVLQEQNKSLCAVISHMREQIENLTVIKPSTSEHRGEVVLKKQNTATQTSRHHSDKTTATQTGTRHHHEDVFNVQQHVKNMESGGMSCKCSQRNTAALYSRLKKAVSFIIRLSSDKLQLIEMNNTLRSQEPVEPESEICVKEKHLSALEQLQYKLTTQSCKKRSKALPVSVPESDVSSWFLSSVESLKDLWEKVDQELSLETSSEGERVQRKMEARPVPGKHLSESKVKSCIKTRCNIREKMK